MSTRTTVRFGVADDRTKVMAAIVRAIDGALAQSATVRVVVQGGRRLPSVRGSAAQAQLMEALLRVNRTKSLRKFASAVGVSPGLVTKIRRGQDPVTRTTARKILAAANTKKVHLSEGAREMLAAIVNAPW